MKNIAAHLPDDAGIRVLLGGGVLRTPPSEAEIRRVHKALARLAPAAEVALQAEQDPDADFASTLRDLAHD